LEIGIQSGCLHHFLSFAYLQRQQEDQNCKNFQCLLYRDDPFEAKSKKEEWFEIGVGVGG